MKKLFISVFLSIVLTGLSAQKNLCTIPLQTKFANSFEFIVNSHKQACLFLDNKDRYDIVLLDSNYAVLAEFSDRFYTSKPPTFIGSLAGEDKFELFFRRFENDILLILTIDTKTKTITRTKDFKITEFPREKVIYTGSNEMGNKMATISIAQNKLFYKNHLLGQKIEEIAIQLTDDDKTFIEKGYLRQFMATEDSLIVLFGIEKIEEKNRRYKIFNINLRNSEYNSVDFSCDCKKRQPYLTASFYEDIVLLQNCNDKLSLYDRLNGKMIKELSIDYDSILLNEKIDILKYSYLHDFKGESKRPEYRYLKGDDRKMIKYSDPSFYFVEDSIITYLKIKTFYTINSSSGSYCYARAFLPFDFSRKMILYGQASQNLKFNDYTIYHINKLSKSKIIVSGYFYGFHGEILFGYFPNKTKQFIIEKME